MARRRSAEGAEGEEHGAKLFAGVRFLLSGFDRAEECEFIDILEQHGGSNVGQYSLSCTHVIVSTELTYDDPVCAAARKDGKALVTKFWVKDCLEQCALIDTNSVLYRPVRDPSGIPGGKKLCMCLTGYPSVARREIERMVRMMGATFSKPLVANKVTHLICYKFEGDKYILAKRQGLKLVNHRWLEDCLKAWLLLDEKDYAVSGYELELAEEEEIQRSQARQQDAKNDSGLEQTKERAGANHNRTPKTATKEPINIDEESVRTVPPGEVGWASEHNDEARTPMRKAAERGKENNEEGSTGRNSFGKTPLKEEANELNGEGSTSRGKSATSGQANGHRKEDRTPIKKEHMDKKTSDTEGTTAGEDVQGNNRRSEDVKSPLSSSRKRKSPSISTTLVHTENTGDDAMNFDKANESKTEIFEDSDNMDNSPDWLNEDTRKKRKEYKTYEHKSREKKTSLKDKEKSNASEEGSKGGSKGVKGLNSGYCFALSGHSQEKKRYTGIIRRLQGRTCKDDHKWKEQTTHCVMAAPLRRTEKFFAALASGRWVLKFDYLQASEKAGMFVHEEEYEWYDTGMNDEGTIDLRAPRKWRISKQQTGCGAFEGLRVIIYGECILPPLDTLQRAIKAGGGNVLATKAPYTQFLERGVDFAIIAFGIPIDDPNVAEMLKHHVACVKDEFFVEYICKLSPSKDHILFNTGADVDKALAKLEKNKTKLQKLQAERSSDTLCLSNSDSERDEGEACNVCGRTDQGKWMLLCDVDGCSAGTHTFCLDPPLKDVPAGHWYCSSCTKSMQQAK